ncbi:hypothetical protein SLEP1_g44611 [Rubroshorea leprosula]|uniref:GBF-interacting protein 1 N-terminal domain-containing protein n=1 Tax=Rubroshorea leprosula TaxID=152421 RepID=A0AAV5LGP0_9ROSI|nr:hypothetical protein SLEP1_g44611 [Rubroshorea leprosula]
MSSSGRGGEAFRVLIPENAKKTIQNIREITGKKHSDEEIYAVLKECDMDPNDTAQKLFYLDTFHEVKSKKRDCRKETAGMQGRGTRGARGNHSNNTLSDFGAGRNTSARRENGTNHITDSGSIPLPVSQRGKRNAVSYMKKSPTAVPNGRSNLSDGSLIPGGVSKGTKDAAPINVKTSATAAVVADVLPVKESSNSVSYHTLASLVGDQEKPLTSSNQTSTSATVSSINLSASDLAFPPSLPHHSGAVGTIKYEEVEQQQEATEVNHIQGNIAISNDQNLNHSRKDPGKPKAAEQIDSSVHLEHSPPQGITSEISIVTVKDNSKLPPTVTSDDQHVIFPAHFQVSEALKNGLTFGSFDPSFGLGMMYNNVTNSETNSACAVESSQGSDETAEELSPSNQSVSSALQGDTSEEPQPPVFEEVPESDSSIPSTADLKNIQSNKEIKLQVENDQGLNVQNAPSYNLGFMQPLSTSNFVQCDGSESQIHGVSRFSHFVNGNAPAPSGSSTPPVSSSVVAPPQAVPFFRQPFPHFPYYLSPFLMSPMHQFLSPGGGLPQQPSTGNVYLPPGAPPSGVKIPLPQFKPGANAGNVTHVTIPSGYGSYNTPPVGFNPVPTATSGGSTSKEDLAASQLKENNVNATGTPSDGPALWMPTPGQDLSNLTLGSLYNFSLHGQHVAFSHAQAGHGSFAGLYQTPQTMAAPSNFNPLLQQSQPVAAAAEPMGPITAYQQPQLAQLNWNTNY